MLHSLSLFVASLFFVLLVSAQQYAGDVIPNSLPGVPGSELVYFRIKDPAGLNNNLTLTNYQSKQTNGNRLVPSQVERVVIVIHGLNRDPGTYMSNVCLQEVELLFCPSLTLFRCSAPSPKSRPILTSTSATY